MTPNQIRAYKQAITLICAEMIEGVRHEHEGEFGEGYRCAQRELAEMLRKVARGEMEGEACREVHER